MEEEEYDDYDQDPFGCLSPKDWIDFFDWAETAPSWDSSKFVTYGDLVKGVEIKKSKS